jgi:hypothetical protein
MSYKLSRSGPWQAVGGAAFSLRYGVDGDLREIGQEYSQWWRASAGFRHVTDRNMFDFRLKGELFDYDFNETVYSVGPEFTFVHVVNPKFVLVTSGALDSRDYVRNHPYDGIYGAVGQAARWTFGQAGHEFTVGGRYLFGNADDDNNSYDGWEASAAFRFKLPRGYEISPSVSYVEERYDGPANVLDTSDREDDRLRLGLSVFRRVNEKLGIEASYNYTDNESNSDLHDYDRHAINLGCVWNF